MPGNSSKSHFSRKKLITPAVGVFKDNDTITITTLLERVGEGVPLFDEESMVSFRYDWGDIHFINDSPLVDKSSRDSH